MAGARGGAKSLTFGRATGAVETFARKFDTRKRGREDGARNLPRPESETFSEAERAVIAAAAAEAARLDQTRQAARAATERRLRALAPSRQDFAGPALEARLSLSQIEGRLAHDWALAAERARAVQRDLARFKQRHDLRRQAIYPDSPLLQAGLLFCAALFEAMFSAALFADEMETGLLGGATIAVGLSGANVVLGFLGGFLGLRYLQHVDLALKIAGGAGFTALAGLALFVNVFAALWRQQLSSGAGPPPDDGGLAAHVGSFFQQLFYLTEPQAIILLMLGAGVWVFAVLKGYSGIDDPYPDYGKMDRAAHDAEEALSEFRAEAREDLEAPVNSARATLAARLEKMHAEVEAMAQAFDAAALRMEEIDADTRALDAAAASAIQAYRQENLAARTNPAPAYFAAAPPMGAQAPDSLQESAALLAGARARLHEAETALADSLKALHAELEAAQMRLDTSRPAAPEAA